MDHSPSDTGPSPGTFGGWHNITLQAAQQFLSTVNISKHVPSFDGLIWAGPRIMRKFGLLTLPPDGITEFESNEITGLPDSDNLKHLGMMAADISGDASSPPSMPVATHEPPGSSPRLSADSSKGLGSVFSYATSKWAICCVAMAIILNRAYIFAATRRRLVLPWQVKLAIRGVPLLLLGMHARQLLQSLQCQTSTEFSSLRWDNSNRSSDLMFAHPNRFLHSLSSVFLLGPSDRSSCLAVKMIPQPSALDSAAQDIRGSLGLLWPLFGTFCLSQLVETIVCAVEGRPLTAETGMTLFEHSLAFAEAETAISNQLGLGGFTFASAGASAPVVQSAIPISRSMILSRVNTPPEVLLVAFVSTLAHITSHSLGVFSLQARCRLASTTVWGLCFMASIFWSAVTFSLDATGSQSLLRYPTVCIIGFIPHVLVLSGIVVCVSIYGLALGLSALVPPPGQETASLTVRQRLVRAQANLQASISFSELRITREMDFYTALLRAGFGAISLASEAVYLNEDSNIAIPSNTWLEERRLQQLEELQEQWPSNSGCNPMASTTPVPRQGGATHTRHRTGFARERPVQKVRRRRPGVDRMQEDGVGAAVRSARWLVAMDYVLNIGRVIFKLWGAAVLGGLKRLGLEPQSSWLLRLFRDPKDAANKENRVSSTTDRDLPAEDSSPTIPGFRVRADDQLDVETELRAHIQANDLPFDAADEEKLDSQLYEWWLNGHTWGQIDESGDYAGSEDASDADDTSVVSLNDTLDDKTEGWVVEKDGGLSQIAPYPRREDSPVLDTPIQVSDLSRLLRPQNPEEQEEADTLSAHLASNEILTRSRYRRVRRLQLARVLATGAPGHSLTSFSSHPAKFAEQDETRLLEQILISRREARGTMASSPPSLDPTSTRTSRTGLEGLQCVVCQSASRTIIVWPCRCLSLCDDCRVALAMNNFDRCVCCRREVSSFGRIYVP